MNEPVNHLDEFLRTDPDDAGCGRTMAVLHVFAETLAAETRFPDVAVHLRVCGPCAEDYRLLLDALRSE